MLHSRLRIELRELALDNSGGEELRVATKELLELLQLHVSHH